jgi:hypothetical protein
MKGLNIRVIEKFASKPEMDLNFRQQWASTSFIARFTNA